MSYLYASFYRFHTIADRRLTELRDRWKERCIELELRGTLLLAREGVNGMLSGAEGSVREMIRDIESEPGFENLAPKEGRSRSIAFQRMKVKIRPELIPLGEAWDQGPPRMGHRLDPQELKRWLDEGRPVTLVDTRNDFEFARGSFTGAMPVGMGRFRSFREKMSSLKAAIPGDRPVVFFCTGGIRCEKATAWAVANGMDDVWQLDGGILRYFERAGGSHWRGECFVFDERVALAPT